MKPIINIQNPYLREKAALEHMRDYYDNRCNIQYPLDLSLDVIETNYDLNVAYVAYYMERLRFLEKQTWN